MALRNMTMASTLARQLAQSQYPTATIAEGMVLKSGRFFELPVFITLPAKKQRGKKQKKPKRISRYVQVPVVVEGGPARWRE